MCVCWEPEGNLQFRDKEGLDHSEKGQPFLLPTLFWPQCHWKLMGPVHHLPSRQRMKTPLPTTRSPTPLSMPPPSAATSTLACMKAMVVRAGMRPRPGEEGRQVGTGLHFTPLSGGGPPASQTPWTTWGAASQLLSSGAARGMAFHRLKICVSAQPDLWILVLWPAGLLKLPPWMGSLLRKGVWADLRYVWGVGRLNSQASPSFGPAVATTQPFLAVAFPCPARHSSILWNLPHFGSWSQEPRKEIAAITSSSKIPRDHLFFFWGPKTGQFA